MNELLIDLDVNAKTALYEQIYEYIKRDIISGRLSRGERLPSTRLLALNLQVSRSTVEAAYGQLASEGYLEAKKCSGYYVCDMDALYALAGKAGCSKERFYAAGRNGDGLSDEACQAAGQFYEGNTKRYRLSEEALPPVKYNFLPGQIDSKGFPYNAWRKASKEALLEMEHELLLAGHPQGEYELRKTIADYLYQARGAHCVPEQIIIGAGNEYLLQLLGQILGNSRKAAMESPTYLQAYHTFQNMGYEVKAVPMDADGMLVEKIPEEEISLVYVMPSHQFPLGTVMPLKRRLQLLAWADGQAGRYIIEDDHDSEFRYKGKPIPSLHGMAQQESVIYLGTFSNSIMPSIRISYMALPAGLLAVYYKKCGFYASTVSRIQQMAVCRFMKDGCFERHLNKMRGIYKGKHDTLLQLLKGKKWVRRIYGDYAGLHIAVELNCALSEEAVIKQAAAQGIRLQGMSDCYLAGQKKPDENPVLLLGFGDLSEQEIREGVELLEKFII